MRFLIIQTAFIGDVVLATAMIESLKKADPDSTIDFLLGKGNEGLLTGHPHINELLILDKKKGKFRNLFKMLKRIQVNKYDYVINPHRFASSGFLTAFSGAKNKIGFDKNPFTNMYSKSYQHNLEMGMHEVERNHQLISDVANEKCNPKLYPSDKDFEIVPDGPYVCMAPASVWFTKQYPKEKWIDLINRFSHYYSIHLIGGPGDKDLCEEIARSSDHPKVINSAGAYSFLQSAALISKAKMTYANDSAPLHFASAMDAPVTAIFCSTVPKFGFGPLSTQSHIAQSAEKLDCRPCGVHGKKECPLGHFKCSEFNIDPL